MQRKAVDWITVGCIAALLVQWLYVVLSPFERLNMYVQDDAYYYILVARHWVRDGFPSLDGFEATNGFQPLWQLVQLPLALVVDRLLNLKLVLALGALLYQVGIWSLAVSLRQLAGTAAGSAFVVLIQLNVAASWSFALNGMESSIQIAILGAIVLTLTRALSRAAAPVVTLALLVGLYGLTRIDNLALIPFVALWIVWHSRRLAPAARFALLASIPALLLFAANLLWTGGPFPVSGEVKLAWNRTVLDGLGGGAAAHLSLAVPNLARALFKLLSPALNGYALYFACPFAFPYRWITFPSGILCSVAMLAAFVHLVRARPLALVTVAAPVAAASLVRLAFYSWSFPSDLQLYRWYYAAELMMVMALLALLVAAVPWRRLLLAGLAVVATAHLLVFMNCDDFMADYRGLEEAAGYLASRPELAGQRLGAWDAGCVAFVLPQAVTNLDGVINSRRYASDVLGGSVPLAVYLRERGIRHVLNIVVGEQPQLETGFRGLRPGEYVVEYVSPPHTGPFRDIKRFVVIGIADPPAR